jgi:nucleotide-binding universal stress UspA family protein
MKKQAAAHTRSMTVSGDPAEEILKYVQREKVDLVVMGTHGRKGIHRILFGSVADRVTKMAPLLVMRVKPYRTPYS